MLDNRFATAREFLAEGEKQSRAQGQPRQHAHERVSRRLQQKERSDESACKARGEQRNHHAPRNVQSFSIGSSTACGRCPKRDRVRCVGGNRRHTREQERGKCDETSSSCHRIQSSAQSSGEK